MQREPEPEHAAGGPSVEREPERRATPEEEDEEMVEDEDEGMEEEEEEIEDGQEYYNDPYSYLDDDDGVEYIYDDE